MEHAPRTVVEAQQDVAVVFQQTAVDEGGQVGTDGVDAKSGDRLGEILGVGPDVADAAGDPCTLRIRPPVGLLLPLRLEPGGEPTLRILDDDLAHFAEFAASDPVASLLDHRIAGVVVGESEHEPGALDGSDEFLRFRRGLRHRLVAHHVKAGFQSRTATGK